MRVLILSCNTGGGHNSCSVAIQEAFSANGHSCDVADSLSFVSDNFSKFMSWGHTAIYRHIPFLFRMGYDFVEKHPSVLQDDATVYKLLTNGTLQLYRYIQAGKYDSVICSHVFAGLLLRQTMREFPLHLKTAFVATDYTCYPGASNCELDRYFIPADSLIEDFVSQGIAEDKLITSGIPVRGEFYEPVDRAAARAHWSIAPTSSHLLAMCGSMGCGPLKKLTKLFLHNSTENMELSIVCGTNEKLRQELSNAFGHAPNIHIHGFVTDMNSLMASADLYLTKPGGLSTTEAAAKGLPMVFIDAVAGCENYNSAYFVRCGGAVTADSPEALAQLCLDLMGDSVRLNEMKLALEALPRQNAARRICDVTCAAAKGGNL